MRGMRKLAPVLIAGALWCACAAHGQDEPSLGDVARQTRQQRQLQEAQVAKDKTSNSAQSSVSAGPVTQAGASAAKEAQPAKTARRVITNDEIPEHVAPAQTSASYPQPRVPYYQQPTYKAPADYLKEDILSQKQAIARQEEEIERVESSIVGGNCVTNCVQWYEQQRQKQEQVERMKTMLEQMKKHLEAEQELSRKAGYSSSVYDP